MCVFPKLFHTPARKEIYGKRRLICGDESKGISSRLSGMQFASRPLFLSERGTQIYGIGIPMIPKPVPDRSFDSLR
jgi:hypothetical protein